MSRHKDTEDLPIPRALTVDDAAAQYRIGRTKLYELMREGVLPHTKRFGRRRIDRNAMERLIFGERLPGPGLAKE